MSNKRKPVVYISGAITGKPRYWEKFEAAEDELIADGFIPLSPAHLPEGMDNSQYMRICFSMIDSADAVLFLTDWSESNGARLEHMYCMYTGKAFAYCPKYLKSTIGRLEK